MWRNAKQKLWLLAELGVVCLIGFMLIGLVIGTGSATDYQEKELRSDGRLAVYIHHYPRGREVEVGNAYLLMSVFNATPDWPLYVHVGNATWLIKREGVFKWSWDVVGEEHHLVVRSNSTVFLDVKFKVVPPKTAPGMKTVVMYLYQLLNLKMEIIRNCGFAALAGVALGYGCKRWTRIHTRYGYVLPAVAAIAGYYYDLYNTGYILVILGIIAAVTYKLLPEFCDWLILVKIDRFGIDSDKIAVDNETNEYLAGWTWRGLKRKELVLEQPYPILFDGENAVIVSEVVETDEALIIRGDPALARALTDAQIVRKLDERIGELEARNRMLEEAQRMAVFEVVKTVEELRRAYRAKPTPETLRALEERMARLLAQLQLVPEGGEEHVEGPTEAS